MQKSVPGAARDLIEYGTKESPDYQRKKRARQEVSEEISKKHPVISGMATAADIGTDVAATLGTGGGVLGAAAVGGGLSLAHAGSRMFEEPGQVLGEAGISALGAAAIGGIVKGATSTAARRGAARALPAQKEAVRAQNVAGKAAMDQSNLAKKQQYTAQELAKDQQFAAEKTRVKNENAAREHQFKTDLNDRANRRIQAENDIKQKIIDRDNEVKRIDSETDVWSTEDKLGIEKRNQEIKRMKEDYALKDQQYKEDLRKVPELQRKSQAEHSQNVQKSVNEIVATIPAETKISSDLIGVGDFIGEKIIPTAIGGTREAAQVSKILKSLFPEGESFSAKELGKKYGLLEDAIRDNQPAVADYLSRFKEHLGDRIPSIVKDNTVHSKIMPILAKQIEKDIAEAVKKISFPFVKNNAEARNAISIKAMNNLTQLLQKIGPENFAKKLQSGEIANILRNGILTSDEMLASAGVKSAAKLRKSGEYDILIKPGLKKAYTRFINDIQKGIEESLYKNDFKARELGENAEKRLGEALKKTFGIAPPVESPIAPHAPGSAQNPLPSEYVAPPRTATPYPPEVQETIFKEPLPSRQPPLAEPGAPIPGAEPTYGQFTAAQEPQLSPAQGFAERAGDFLEKPILGKGSAGSANILKNPLARLGGGLSALHFLPGAKVGAGAYLAAKGLTSPTAAGAAARMTFKQGGIQAIISWAQKYPSYHDGVLEDPQERRSLSKEIEDDPDMTPEEKALEQSKNHRGKRLDGNLF